MSTVQRIRNVSILALLYVLVPIGPDWYRSLAHMSCYQPPQFINVYDNMTECQNEITRRPGEYCGCRVPTNKLALAYYFLVIPFAFAVGAIFGLKGRWLSKAATMNAAIILGGVGILMVIAPTSGSDTGLAFASGLILVCILALGANGLFTLIHLTFYLTARKREN